MRIDFEMNLINAGTPRLNITHIIGKTFDKLWCSEFPELLEHPFQLVLDTSKIIEPLDLRD